MADCADRADQVVQDTLNRALDNLGPVPAPGEGSDACVECDDPIPRARSALGYSTCITCQELIELESGR